MRILVTAAEVAPFKKTGGLGDVVGALPRALAVRGHDVRLVMPLYRGIDWHELERLDGTLVVPMFYGPAHAAARLGRLPGSEVRVYFIEHLSYFDRPEVYGPGGGAYHDNLERFTFLSRASLALCKALAFHPDVLHANDWHTALVPVYVNTVEWGQPLHGAATVLTIHNLAHQGIFSLDDSFVTGLGREHFHAGELEHFGAMNVLKGGLQHATMLSAVSPTYAREIQNPAQGVGLDGVLAARRDSLWGILNGIDEEEWDPARDPHLVARYDGRDRSNKRLCKSALQQEMGLPVRDDVPLYGAIGRLTHQKGFDVLARALDRVLDWSLQLVLLGSGDPEAERYFAELSGRRGEKFRARIGFDNGLAHRIEAGSDFFVMPSRFEPCGLNQMYSLRYGTLPIVRATGGLADTVQNYDEATAGGTGFVFSDLTPQSLADTMGWALSTYYNRPSHIARMQERGMARDFSWARSAERYEALYREAWARRRGHPFPA